MRQTEDARQVTIRQALVQSYHGGSAAADGTRSSNYAYNGFDERRYFASDRSEKLDSNFRRENGCALLGYGLEIEAESTMLTSYDAFAEVMERLVYPYFPQHLFKMQRDGSLGDGYSSCGVETITQVMTREFIRNHYKDFYRMWQTFRIFEISASESGNCGMHCNISMANFGKTAEKQVEALRKLTCIVNKYYKTMCYATGRDVDRTGYCQRMTGLNEVERAKTFSFSQYTSHYNAFNFDHVSDVSGRVELRFVGGQSGFEQFRNTMELIFFLVDRSRKIKWEQVGDVVEVFKGCNQYVCNALKVAKDHGALKATNYNAIREASVVDGFDFAVERQ